MLGFMVIRVGGGTVLVGRGGVVGFWWGFKRVVWSRGCV